MLAPLAERLRPRTLDDYIGQKHLVGEGSVLRRMIDTGNVSSFILWGPPGVGKTTLALAFAKALNLVSRKKVNPMIGAAGISAFPMASRVVHKLGLEEDPYNFLLMHAAGANVSGQIASVIAGGLLITLVERML